MNHSIIRARAMRQSLSQPETILWSRLKRLRGRGLHFRRQAPFRGYYLDFVCYTRRLVVEVDGAQHGDDRQADHDAVRDRVLQRHGFTVLRFWASQVRYDTDRVVHDIVAAAEAAPVAHGREAHLPRERPTSPP